jgi:hypothetical protein
MAKDIPTGHNLGGSWLSWLLLVMAYATYGRFLHDGSAEPLGWILSGMFAIAMSGIVTILWVPTRRIILLGFKSDIGYAIMVLVIASLAVLAVVQIKVFSYFLVLTAVSLLARVDTLISDLRASLAFLLLTLLAFVGLGISWIPSLLAAGPNPLSTLHPTMPAPGDSPVPALHLGDSDLSPPVLPALLQRGNG